MGFQGDLIKFMTGVIIWTKSINQKMIELGKAYKDFMFRNDPSKEVIKELKQDVPDGI
ncbi:MAG TPA: hypothetical protein PLI77_03555 [Bacteroidales bacterium]|nr:hypothetical protein [Bacteroidales bacterium]